MIQIGTFIKVIDNSGAKEAQCLKILNHGYNKKYAEIGDLILVAIKETYSDTAKKRKKKASSSIPSDLLSKVKKGEMHKGIVLYTKIPYQAKSHLYIYGEDNGVILLDKQYNLLGTRIFGKMPEKFRYSKFLKLIACSSGLLN
jgi:large subunit ribosomal protein L14